MKFENYLNLTDGLGVGGLFFTCGDFGVVDGGTGYSRCETDTGAVYTYENGRVRLRAELSEQDGIVSRRDYFENLTDSSITVNKLVSRFLLDGDAYEVYTQYNGWQHENEGAWQRLVTQVSAASEGIRTCEGAAPIMALCNLYSKQATVFHLVPNAQWRMTARKFPISEKEHVVVETGFEDSGMHLEVAAGETVELPEVIFYSTRDRDGLGAERLHEYYNRLYPRRRMPVLYNSWLYNFDKLGADGLYRQVDTAAELGIEAFMIDAGWFGDGSGWFNSVGDWVENPEAIGRGGLAALSEYVRSKGMIFGLWFEPERASETSKSVAANPNHYINKNFLDFSNREALETILESVSSQIEKYSIGWVKFDFNASIPYDVTGSSFYRYMQGQREFISRLRERFPELYITNCASGGARMELGQSQMYDSFWPSDNESALDELTIIKNSLKRLPSQLIERWAVLKWSEGFPWYEHEENHGLMLTCRGATWSDVEAVSDAHTLAFMTGGPIGFSCDIASFPEQYKAMFKEHIAKFKKDREFYLTANARILVDSERIVAIEYADAQLSRCIVNVFTKQTHAANLNVYPVLDAAASYVCGGEVISGADAIADGILIADIRDNDCAVLEFIKQ